MSKESKNHNVFVTSYVGNLGTKFLIEKKRKDLKEHYSDQYIDKILSDCGSGPLFDLSDVKDMIDSEPISKGGVLAALWKICERNKCGLRYRLIDIPIHQGTIEISNFFDINPYRLMTEDGYIVIANDEKVRGLSPIGETNDEKKRVRVDGEAEAFLTKYYRDEIYKICN